MFQNSSLQIVLVNSMDFWSLPGPAQFLKNIEDELKEGNNVIAVFPKIFKDKSTECFSLKLLDNKALTDEIDLSDFKGSTPLSILSRLCSEKNLSSIEDINLKLKMKKFFINKINDTVWPDWRDLIVSHSATLKNSALRSFERPTFFLTIQGKQEMPHNDVCLRIIEWNGIVSDLDMMIYVSEFVNNRNMNEFERALTVQAISDIALWDFEIADAMIEANLKDVVEPFDLLRNINEKRKWNGAPPCWENGQTMKYMGNQLESSVLLVSRQTKTPDIFIRLWRSQVRVLLPLIEEQRRNLISLLRKHLTVPFKYNYGSDQYTINELEDLELGHIWHQTKDIKEIDIDLKECLNDLREIRNKLAHFKPLNYELIERYKSIESFVFKRVQKQIKQ